MGDPNGIGPEIIIKALSNREPDSSTPVIFGHETVFKFYADLKDRSFDFHVISSPENSREGEINLVNCSTFDTPSFEPGSIQTGSGLAAMQAVEEGIKHCMAGTTDALVTAPISKEAISLADYDVPGHTEFLARKSDTNNVLMMLVSGDLRVALATTHIPVKDIAAKITSEHLATCLKMLNQTLKEDFGIDQPKIAVFGLNPHAGDGGVIGQEEIEIIQPVLNELSGGEISVSGPHAADGFFGKKMHKNVDAVFAMYHDQGLVPFKALTFGTGVNFTAGLPFIRTSPDHGTAFDIAGKNLADPGSFESAYRLAIELSANKNHTKPE